MKLFKKPKWLRPEVNEVIYYVHVAIIVFVVYFLVDKFVSPMPLDYKTVGLGVLFITIGDVIAHSLLGLD